MTARTKLLRTQVAKLEPQAKPFRIYDLEVPALCVEVRPTGRKAYILAYRLPGGRAGRYREMRLGTHPGLVPEKARELALGHLAKLVDGVDPVEALREARKPAVKPLTVVEAVEKYVEALAGRPGQKAPKSALNVYIRPWKHADDPAVEIRPAQVRSLLAQITERHTTKLRAGGHVVSALREAFRYCREHDLIPKGEDPTAGVTIHTGKRVRRIASAEEMAQVVAAVRSEWQAGQLWPPTLGLILLLMATGARPNELRTAKRTDLDRRRGVLVLEKHKTSSTSGAREIALSPAALAILDMIPT
ncbi:MAG TPA: integrase family protein, partial [Geminicoccus sp.]|uniref:integrase family protein n=1 Tax=Geminicoccus sp. TaxID=2024832 RepID=UPI002BAEB4CD